MAVAEGSVDREALDGRYQPGDTADLQPLGPVVLSALRSLWWVLPLAVVIGLLVASITESETAEREATARVGLTDQVVWPFYDAARDRQRLILEDPETVETIIAGVQANGEVSELTLDIPVDQAFVDVVAVATTAEAAIEAADRGARLLVDLDTARQTEELVGQLAAARTEFNAVEQRIANIDVRLEAAALAEAAAKARITADPLGFNIEPNTIELLQQQDERADLRLRKAEELRLRTPLLAEMDELDRRLPAIESEVEVLRSAELTDEAEVDRSQRNGIIAALVTVVVAVAVAVALEREYGTVRTGRQISQLGARAVVTPGRTAFHRPRPEDLDLLLAARVLDQLHSGRNIVGLAAAPRALSAPMVEAMATNLTKAGLRVMVATKADPLGADWRTLDQLTVLDANSPRWARDLELALDEGHFVRVGFSGEDEDPASQLRAGDALLRAAQRVDVVVVDCGRERDDAVAWQFRVRLCQTVAVIAARKRTRINRLRVSLSTIRNLGVPILGVVLVDTHRGRAESGTTEDLLPVLRSTVNVRGPLEPTS